MTWAADFDMALMEELFRGHLRKEEDEKEKVGATWKSISSPTLSESKSQETKVHKHKSTLSGPHLHTLLKDQKHSLCFKFDIPDILPPQPPVFTATATQALFKQHIVGLGDATVSGFGGRLRDDFVPPACTISYAIQFQIMRADPLSGTLSSLYTTERALRIKPALDGSLMLHPDLVSQAQDQAQHSVHGPKIIYTTGPGPGRDKKKKALGQLFHAFS
ncbi:hypothetical protein BDW74DRAFT_183357 [Aspergillus multicolor]|uniref:uncharacterized protein n=1 Tax=Aspergillus multicolor TaxID=41759 RepID=UPI003CCE0073